MAAAAPSPLTSPAAAPVGGLGQVWPAIFLLGVAVWYGCFLLRPARLQWLGFNEYPLFIDSLAVLSAAEAAQQGYDVYKPVPLDPYRRPHVYPSSWLLLGRLGLTRDDNRWFGPLTLAAFALALALTVRPRTGVQCFEAWVVAGSAGVLLAVVRANNDLWIFALFAGLVPIVRARERLARWCAPFVIAAGAALKYYPAIGAVLLVSTESRRDRWIRVGIFSALMLIVGAGLVRDLRRFRDIQPGIDQFLSFGAPLVLRQIGVAVTRQTAIAIACGVVVALAGGWAMHRTALVARLSYPTSDALYFVLGAALLAGCFWTEANWGYRWLFGLWLLPVMWKIGGDPAIGGSARILRIVRWAWWAPLWFEMICVAAKRVMPVSDTAIWIGWWTCQGIAWLWFSLLTALVAAVVWRRLLDDPDQTDA